MLTLIEQNNERVLRQWRKLDKISSLNEVEKLHETIREFTDEEILKKLEKIIERFIDETNKESLTTFLEFLPDFSKIEKQYLETFLCFACYIVFYHLKFGKDEEVYISLDSFRNIIITTIKIMQDKNIITNIDQLKAFVKTGE